MKKVLAMLVVVMVTLTAVLVYRAAGACGRWQERYKRFLYIEIMKTSPDIYTPARIEAIVGERPAGCDRPGPGLSEADLNRFRREPVDEFEDETNAAFGRTNGFQNL